MLFIIIKLFHIILKVSFYLIDKENFLQVVIFRDGQYLTLKEVFESLDLTGLVLNCVYLIFYYQSVFLMTKS